MLEDSLDYDKTVDTNRLVFKGQKSQKVHSYIFLFILYSTGGVSVYKLLEYLLTEKPSFAEYLASTIGFFLVIILLIYGSKNLLNRDKLKEIEIHTNKEDAKFKLIKAAENIGWKLSKMRKDYLILETNYSFATDKQTVTIIFFPFNKVYFNSLDYPNDYIRPAKFDYNYDRLLDEYLKIEKE